VKEESKSKVPVPAREQVEEEIKQPVEAAPVKKTEKVAAAKVEAQKPKSEAAAEMEKISTYNGASTEKYNWS
jgi:hypothetical protein